MALSGTEVDTLARRLDQRYTSLLDEVRDALEQSENQQYIELIGREPADIGGQSPGDALADLNLAIIDRHVRERRDIEAILARDGTRRRGCTGDGAIEDYARRQPRGMHMKEAIVKEVRRALEREPRINLHRFPVAIGFADDAVVLEGEVESIAAKKLALERAGAVAGIRGVVDRLQVVPAERRGDGAIGDSLCAALLQVAELRNCTIGRRAKSRVETLRDAGPEGDGTIEAAVEDGEITLEGTVISLSHKRLAGVLAWWTSGCRDVVNSLEIVPPEEDNDAEVIDALRLVLEIDPLIHSEQITASARDYVVTLEGCVRSDEERRRAEHDAWALFAVDDVVNRIEVRA